jgi:hypothetical protein
MAESVAADVVADFHGPLIARIGRGAQASPVILRPVMLDFSEVSAKT